MLQDNIVKNKLNLKKRLFSMLLVLALLSGSVPGALPAAAETPDGNAASETAAGEDTASLPQVGQVVNGFEAVETRDFPLMDADVVRFVHKKTGAELYYIANDDTNRVFDLTFNTEALDKTGLPHVFEHAVLSGSEKYPSTQLFFNLQYQTYNTYMNALTYSGYTTYPVASLSEAQLLKYADYYVDSCFHPIVLKDEKIFRTEAWSSLTVIFPLMKRRNSLSQTAAMNPSPNRSSGRSPSPWNREAVPRMPLSSSMVLCVRASEMTWNRSWS